MISTSQPLDDSPLWDIMMSIYRLPIMTVADEVGLFAAVDGGAVQDEALCSALGLPRRSVDALVDALVAMDLLRRDADGGLQLAPIARQYLLPASADYWGPMLMLWRQTTIDHGRMIEAVRAGGGRLPSAGQPDLWAVNAEQDAEAEGFTAAMEAHSRLPARMVAQSGRFADTRRLLDVGGGSGCFALTIAAQHPQLHATIMDIPSVCRIANGNIARAGIGDRVDSANYDMFGTDWPTGYDAIFFSNIFHDWNREQCETLARNAFAALPPGGTIHVHEMMKSDDAPGPLAVACYSVDMLLFTEGAQFRTSEISAILEKAGFTDIVFDKGSGYFWLATGVKPSA